MTGRQAIMLWMKNHSTFRTKEVADAMNAERSIVTSAAQRMTREGETVVIHRKWPDNTYRLTTDEERAKFGPLTGINVICAECRNSPVMKRILTVYGRASA